MTERKAAAPRGPYGAWFCLLVALALEVVRGQREGRGGEGRPGPVRPRPRAIDAPKPLDSRTKPRAMPWRGLTLGNRFPANSPLAFFSVHHLDAPKVFSLPSSLARSQLLCEHLSSRDI